MSFIISDLKAGPKPEKASSKSNIGFDLTIDLAKETRVLWPPESWKGLINLNFESYNVKPSAFESMFGSFNKVDIKPGDRIAQLIIEKCYQVEWNEMKTLENSERGQGGFGSSGE